MIIIPFKSVNFSWEQPSVTWTIIYPRLLVYYIILITMYPESSFSSFNNVKQGSLTFLCIWTPFRLPWSLLRWLSSRRLFRLSLFGCLQKKQYTNKYINTCKQMLKLFYQLIPVQLYIHVISVLIHISFWACQKINIDLDFLKYM